MSEPCYYIRERNRVTGPYGLAQLREMRRRNRLARFHMVSTDGNTWVEAGTLHELFTPEPELVAEPPPAPLLEPSQTPGPGPSPPSARSPSALWYYAVGSTVHGPVTTRFLQDLIDKGSADPDLPVRPHGATQWARCHEVGSFRFPAHSSGQAEEITAVPVKRFGIVTTRPWLLGLAIAIPTAAVLVASAFTVLGPGQRIPDHPGAVPTAGKDARPAPARPEPAPGPAQPPSPIARTPAGTGKKTVAARPPAPPPPPAATPPRVAENRSANVELPAASVSLSQHDSASHPLEVALPSGSGYRLRLRGLSDAETQKYRLDTRPLQPGHTDSLAVIQTPLAEAGRRTKTEEAQELARFWIEDARLFFKWAPKLTRDLIEPARALRDCILEVQSDTLHLKVALCEVIKDSDSWSVSRESGVRSVPWKSDPPIRKVRITSCKVKLEGEWREVPSTTSQDQCRLAIKVNTNQRQWNSGSTEEPALELTVIWDSAKSQLDANLNTTVNKINQRLKEQRKRIQKLESHINSTRQDYATAQQELKDQINAMNEELRREGQSSYLKLNAAASRPLTWNPNDSQTSITFEETNNQALDELLRRMVTAARNHSASQQQRIEELNRLNALGKMRDEFARIEDAPIQLRLGMLVDGEAVEIASIGQE